MSTAVVSLNSYNPPRPADGAVRVALVDDDAFFREAIGLNLADEGYDVVEFDNGDAALDYLLGGGTADIMLLDWRMPGLDGIQVLQEVRKAGIDVPVIFLTVLSDQIYEEAALAGGAIDFVEKSRSLSILLRRMRLIVDGRKTTANDGEAGAADGETIDWLDRGPLRLNLSSFRAFWDGEQVDLTVTEFKIVRALAERAGENLSYRALYDVVRGEGFVAGYGDVGYRSNVRAFIKRIRQKFKTIDGAFDAIGNYPGFGYSWTAEDG
ncbi:MAG: response regulator [Deinococcus-Thermus bacterium]|jgi:two-component system response regulator ChvI|nr:response regulator [Deinococcota bacterium]